MEKSKKNKWLKAVMITGGIGGLGLLAWHLAQTYTQVSDIADKIKLSVGVPRFHTIRNAEIIIMADNVQVINQSGISVPIDKVYVGIKNQNAAGVWEDLLYQGNSTGKKTLPANGSLKIDPIELRMPLTSIGTALDLVKGNTSRKLKVVTRVTAAGFEVTFENEVDASAVFAGIQNATNLFSSLF